MTHEEATARELASLRAQVKRYREIDDAEALRCRTLQLAHDSAAHPSGVVDRARAYLAFITEVDAKTPRQVIDDALDASDVR